jgi:hypothetical protein
LYAISYLTSLKSSVSESKHAGRDSAEAIIARDEFGRYSPMNRRIESGRLLIEVGQLLCWWEMQLPSWPWILMLLLMGLAAAMVFVFSVMMLCIMPMMSAKFCHHLRFCFSRLRRYHRTGTIFN